MGNFWSAHWPQSHFRHHLLMCRHLPDGGKLTLTNFNFTHWQNGHVEEQVHLADAEALYALMAERFGRALTIRNTVFAGRTDGGNGRV
jgi:N-hydroxyarylamine O-acetyltransferase